MIYDREKSGVEEASRSLGGSFTQKVAGLRDLQHPDGLDRCVGVGYEGLGLKAGLGRGGVQTGK
jgi:hypothetical protein